MPTPPEQNLDAWIASRKETPAAHLTRAVMMEIQNLTQPAPNVVPPSKPSSWLVASACLLAGIGKASLVYHLAF